MGDDAPPRWAPRADRVAFGKSLRERAKRSDQARWSIAERDPIARLRAAEAGRQPELLKIKYGKMATSPFGFLRGGVPVMAPDLAAQPATGYAVQICGDAHVRNLGAYATADGNIVFDINDFDEACRGPWEWDLKRLAISIVLVGRGARCGDRLCRDAATALAASWREAMHDLSELPAVHLPRVRVKRVGMDGPVGRTLSKAKRVTPLGAREDLAQPDGEGKYRFVANRISGERAQQVLAAFAAYRETLGPGRRQVLDGYRPYDVALKIAGTGSLGVANYMVLCEGNGDEDPLILQVKQAIPSTYRALGCVDEAVEHEGQRIVEAALRMQTDVDPFLGWTTIDGDPYYVRQIADHRASIDERDLGRSALVEFARVCGETFAKGHARSGDAAILSAYAGMGDNLDRAIAELAMAGADQVARDYDRFVTAISNGELQATPPA